MAETFPENMVLVEIRLGRTKWRIKKTTAEIVRLFHIEEFAEPHPHVTLFGPFTLKDGIPVQLLLQAVEDAALPFCSIPFLIHGYEMNQGLNGAVIAYRVIPSPLLADLTEAIGASVGSLADTFNTWDRFPDQKWFHVTVANRLDRKSAGEIYRHLESQAACTLPVPERKNGFPGMRRNPFTITRPGDDCAPPPPPLYDEDGLRITVVKGGNIIAEYDLEQHCWFYHGGAAAASGWKDTLGRYRKKNEIELARPVHKKSDDIFVISDLHLGHANIIRYCSRPFPHDAVDEMDQVLIKNWNYTVKPGDRIYHIGDLCYGPYAKSPAEYLQRLNGAVSLIRGNHDEGTTTARQKEMLVHRGIPFALVHNPSDISETFSGWVIHGHHHNNHLASYPFINFEKRRINVSAEVIRYQPVSLSDLCNVIKDYQLKPEIKTILLRGREGISLS
jgi:calcineurin-like phosphoesterase family protein